MAICLLVIPGVELGGRWGKVGWPWPLIFVFWKLTKWRGLQTHTQTHTTTPPTHPKNKKTRLSTVCNAKFLYHFVSDERA